MAEPTTWRRPPARSDTGLLGDWGNDYFIGGDGIDVIFGGFGNDTFEGGFGSDSMFGGGGDDKFFRGDDLFVDYARGGDGNDTFTKKETGFRILWWKRHRLGLVDSEVTVDP